MRSRTFLFTVALLVALAGGFAASRLWQEARPNLVLITLDTVRADRLSVYGGPVAGTAAERLAREGILIQRAYAPSPTTLPSHASMLTGLDPFAHGALVNGGAPVRTEVATLAELLGSNGWTTAAFVSSGVLDAQSGLGRGFDHYDPLVGADADSRRDGAITVERALRWIERTSEKELPFFVWIHLYDAHAHSPNVDYQAPDAFQQRYGATYEAAVAYADHLANRVLEELDRLGELERSLVVYTSDHGEGLGEHGESTHAILIYDSVLRVPLILRLPGGERGGLEIEPNAGLIDILPTVLSELGLSVPEVLEGIDLLAEPRKRERGLYAGSLDAHLSYGWSPVHSLRKGGWKLIRAPRPELYQLEEDPAESSNRYQEAFEPARRLMQELEALDLPQEDSVESVPLEMAERLAALGYAGGVRLPRAEAVDPKDKMHLFAMLQEAARLAGNDRRDEAIEVLDRLLSEDPLNGEARKNLVLVLLNSGRTPRARAEVEAMLTLSERSVASLGLLSRVAQADGRFDEASEMIRERLAAAPDLGPRERVTLWFEIADLARAAGNAQAERAAIESAMRDARDLAIPALRLRYVRLLLAYGELDRAEQELRAAAELAPRSWLLRNNLAVVYLRQKDYVRALAEAERAAELSGGANLARYNQALALVRLGRRQSARTGLWELVKDAPKMAAAWRLLSDVEAQLGDTDGEQRALTRLSQLLSPDHPERAQIRRRVQALNR